MEAIIDAKTDLNAIIDRLKQARIEAGYSSPTKFAEFHAMKVSTYRFHEMGRRPMSVDTINHYAKLLKVHSTWLLTGLGAKDKVVTRMVPLLPWEDAHKYRHDSRHPEYPKVIADRDLSQNAFALRLDDDSMEPRYPEGALIFVDPEETIKNKDFVLISPPRRKKPIFRMFAKGSPDNLAKALNSNYETQSISKHAKFLGKVVQVNLLC